VAGKDAGVPSRRPTGSTDRSSPADEFSRVRGALTGDELPHLSRLEDLVAIVVDSSAEVYVRWSRGPSCDIGSTSCDDLTGVELPGLSVNPLAVEQWWGDRPVELWVARRLYDYRHLREVRGPDVRPWVLEGREVARGPDNEPLVICDRPLAWLDADVVEHATRLVDEQRGHWGPLRRG
jgi:hypothetical protein